MLDNQQVARDMDGHLTDMQSHNSRITHHFTGSTCNMFGGRGRGFEVIPGNGLGSTRTKSISSTLVGHQLNQVS